MPHVAGAGRKTNAEWSEVLGLEGTNKVKCKHCKMEISGKIERIRSHLNKCPKRHRSLHQPSTSMLSTSIHSNEVHEDLMSCHVEANRSTSSTSLEMESAALSPTAPACSSSTPRKRNENAMSIQEWVHSHSDHRAVQPQIRDFAIVTTQAQQKAIDKAIARFFYSSNLSFLTAEQKYFKEMMNILRPGCSTPSRKHLAGHLLDEVYSDVDNSLKEQLSSANCTLTLCMDGWSSVKNDPILASSVHTGKT